MCEEQQTKIAALIVEAFWRRANKQIEQQAIAAKEAATPPPSDATVRSDTEASDES
jgi:hypothetical protein